MSRYEYSDFRCYPRRMEVRECRTIPLPPMWLWAFVSGVGVAVAFLRWLGAI